MPAKKLPPPNYEPTEYEKQLLEARRQRRNVRPATPRMKVANKNGATQVSMDHPDDSIGVLMLMEAFGTDDYDFYEGLLNQLLNAGTHGKEVSEKQINYLISMVEGIGPRDPIESMVAAQMAAVHYLTMTYARKLAHVETIKQQDSAERTLNKLARTFSVQVETLKRYRSKGEQRMVVQHQHLNVAANNAQVNVNAQPQGGGASTFSEDQPHEPKPERISYEPGTAMPGEIEAVEAALPRTGGKRA